MTRWTAQSRDWKPRFWQRVDRSGAGCWPWIGGQFPTGRGYFNGVGLKRGSLAHRVMYELIYGPIPAGMLVLHTCDNPVCVKPDHLWLGTPADNMADMAAKGRGRNGHVPGYKNKLTPDQVKEIRFLADVVGASWAALGRKYGVDRATIRRAAQGVTWKKVA